MSDFISLWVGDEVTETESQESESETSQTEDRSETESKKGRGEQQSSFPTNTSQVTFGYVGHIMRYANSEHVIHRLHLVRDLVDHAQTLQYDLTVKHLLSLLDTLSKDTEPIRQGIAEQLPAFSSFLIKGGGDQGFSLVKKTCLPIVVQLMNDSAEQVRESAVAAFLEMSPLFAAPEEAAQHIIPTVTSMADSDEESRVLCAQIINQLSTILGKELTLQHVLPLYKQLARDDFFRVRKAVASNMSLICETVGAEVVATEIWPVYHVLSDDELWGVKKACADSLVGISKTIGSKLQSENLLPLFEKMLVDKSRWVRSAALEALGPFIATFPQSQVPKVLLDHFRSLATKKNDDSELGDSDHATFCAFNFPAVLFTAGAGHWEELKSTYQSLAKNKEWKVRRSLAFSLHVIGEILSQKPNSSNHTNNTNAEETLLTTLDVFLKDVDEVKVGVIKNFAKTLRGFSTELRKQYLNVLNEIQSTKNWRFRRLLAKQMGDLATLFDAQTVVTCILPLITKLLADPVAHVRHGLHAQIGKVLVSIDTLPEQKSKFIEEIKALTTHKNYQMRLMFIKIAKSSITIIPPEIFDSVFFVPLLNLVEDKVVNVRMFVADALKHFVTFDPYKSNEKLKEILLKYSSDKDSDLVIYSGGTPLRHPLMASPLEDEVLAGSNTTTTTDTHTTTTTTTTSNTVNTTTTTTTNTTTNTTTTTTTTTTNATTATNITSTSPSHTNTTTPTVIPENTTHVTTPEQSISKKAETDLNVDTKASDQEKKQEQQQSPNPPTS